MSKSHRDREGWPESRFHVIEQVTQPAPVRGIHRGAGRDRARGIGRRAVMVGVAGAATSVAAGVWTHSTLGGIAGSAPRRLPATRPLVYAAVGASDAAGFGVRAPQRDGWVPQLAAMLPQPVRLVNVGVPGSTLRQALEAQAPRAVEAQPHLITVWLVVNDVLAGVPVNEYASDLDRLLRRLEDSTDAIVAVANAPYPPASLDPLRLPDAVRRGAVLAWNGVIHSAARKHGALVVDLYEKWRLVEHPEYIGPDGLHPTAAGYRALSEVFATTLREQGVF